MDLKKPQASSDTKKTQLKNIIRKEYMKKIKLYDSDGKEFFSINLKPKFTWLGKQAMFQELEGAVNSITKTNKKNLRLFCDNIIRMCDEKIQD